MQESIKAEKLMISLPQVLNVELNEFSKEFKVSKSKLIQQALDCYFDVLDLRLAKNRIAKNSKRINVKEMKAFVDEL